MEKLQHKNRENQFSRFFFCYWRIKKENGSGNNKYQWESETAWQTCFCRVIRSQSSTSHGFSSSGIFTLTSTRFINVSSCSHQQTRGLLSKNTHACVMTEPRCSCGCRTFNGFITSLLARLIILSTGISLARRRSGGFANSHFPPWGRRELSSFVEGALGLLLNWSLLLPQELHKQDTWDVITSVVLHHGASVWAMLILVYS